MNKKLCRTLAGALSIMFVGQTLPSVRSFAKEDVQETVSYSTQADIIYASDLTIHGYVQKGTIGDFSVRDNELAYVRIFNGDWAEIASAGVADDGSYSVTATGSDVYHVKFECDGYLPFYLKDFGTGSYLVGSGDSVDTVTLIPGDTTYNADNDNQWSDDVLNADDLAYVQSCIGATSYVAKDFNLSMDLNDDGIITQEELDEFCNFYQTLENGTYYDLSDESCDIDCFDVNDDGIINRYDYYLLYDMVYNEASSEIVNIPDLTSDGYFGYEDLQPFWDRINEAADSNKWIWIYNHDMNRDGVVDANDYIPDSLNYYANPPLPSENYHLYMDKNGNGCIDESDAAWFQSAYEQYGDMDWDHAFKRTLTMDANGKFNWSLNLHDTNLNLNGCALYVGESMSFTTDIPSFWSDGEGAELNINSGRLETGNNLVFRTASPDGWDGITGQNMYLNGGSVVIGGDFNFGQANCYDIIWMTNDNDYLEINHNWNYITLTDMEGKWTAGLINFQGPTWEVNEAAGEKSVYSSGTHAIRFYYPDGKQTILWDNPNEYINAEDGTPNTLRTFNFDYIDPETGECLGLIFPNGYSEELYWFRPWFEVHDGNGNFDSDDDGLSDELEKNLHTNPYSSDTDGDGISDYDEVYKTGTYPYLSDTNFNGVPDGEEDYDNDGLNNLKELELGTSLTNDDTDSDGLLDGEEVYKYGTDPLKSDTDGDKIIDKIEVRIGTDPLNKDSDGNGVIDGNQSYTVTFSEKMGDFEVDSNAKLSIKITAQGYQFNNFSANRRSNDPIITNDVIGYIGDAYDINMLSGFESAILTFEFDSSLLNSEETIPAIYYYNEETQIPEKLDAQVLNNNTISAEVTHFSTYMILSEKMYDDYYRISLLPPNEALVDNMSLDFIFVMDSSGSMADNDANGLRKKVAKEFISNLGLSNNTHAAVVDFDDEAKVVQGFTKNQTLINQAIDSIDDEGSTKIYCGIETAINEFNSSSTSTLKYMILLTDGQDDGYTYDYEPLISQASENEIVIYTIGLGDDIDEDLLKKIADKTGGEYYHVSIASQLESKLSSIQQDIIDYMTDSNGDGISDYYSKRICNGTLLTGTKYSFLGKIDFQKFEENADYDGDGLKNGEEIKIKSLNNKVYIYIYSDPTNVDTDGDEVNDYEDATRLKAWQPKTVIGNTVWDAGFRYTEANSDLSTGDIIYARKDADQRKLGFAYAYDEGIVAISSVLDCEPIYFFYDNKEWMVEPWKGQYGIETGAEVGIYYRDLNAATFGKRVATNLDNMSYDTKEYVIGEIKNYLFGMGFETDVVDRIFDMYTFAGGMDDIISGLKFINKNVGNVPDFIIDEPLRDDVKFITNLFISMLECKIYDCVEDQDMLVMTNRITSDKILNDPVNAPNQLFNRTKTNHWWLTGFKWGEMCNDPNELTMAVSITFPNKEMRDAFLNGGVEYSNGTATENTSDGNNNNDDNGVYGLYNLGYNPSINGLTVSFTVKTPYTDQPFTQNNELRSTINNINAGMVDKYNRIKNYLKITTNDPDEIYYSINTFLTNGAYDDVYAFMQFVFEDEFSADMAQNASDYVDSVFNGICNGLTDVHLVSKAFDLASALVG